jgi:pantetheine-phosphate adenylyltransferase
LRIAVYPGTFDPITLGHLDVVKRSINVCDKLIIAVAQDSQKNTLFSLEERVSFIKNDVKALKNNLNLEAEIEVKGFKGLLIDFVKKQNANLIIRGLRAVSDFEYEFQLASMNSRLNPNIQTIFIPASENHQFIASNLVKQVAKLGGDVSGFTSKNVCNALKKKF